MTEATGDFDDVLVGARAGEEWAVARLYERFQPSLYAFVRWQEPSVAEDLTSETWLAVAKHLPRFEGDEGAFRAWLFAIARRRLASHRRRAARRRTVPVPDEALLGLSDGVDPADLAADALTGQQAVRRLVEILPPDQAEVVLLRVLGGLSVEETAKAVSKRPGTVRVIQHRALRRLAGRLPRESAVEA